MTMRNQLYACLMIATLLGVAGGAALAQGGAPDQTERQERIAQMREARNESLAMFAAARSDALADYRAAFNETKAQFLADAADVRADCAAQRNETEDADEAEAHCVRDGMKPLIEAARAEHAEQREELRARLLEARTDAIAAFRAAVREMRAE